MLVKFLTEHDYYCYKKMSLEVEITTIGTCLLMEISWSLHRVDLCSHPIVFSSIVGLKNLDPTSELDQHRLV